MMVALPRHLFNMTLGTLSACAGSAKVLAKCPSKSLAVQPNAIRCLGGEAAGCSLGVAHEFVLVFRLFPSVWVTPTLLLRGTVAK